MSPVAFTVPFCGPTYIYFILGVVKLCVDSRQVLNLRNIEHKTEQTIFTMW